MAVNKLRQSGPTPPASLTSVTAWVVNVRFAQSNDLLSQSLNLVSLFKLLDLRCSEVVQDAVTKK